MSSGGSLRNQNKIKKGFMSELKILKESKRKYFNIQFNRILLIAESGKLDVTKDELKQMMKEYIKNDTKAVV